MPDTGAAIVALPVPSHGQGEREGKAKVEHVAGDFPEAGCVEGHGSSQSGVDQDEQKMTLAVLSEFRRAG